MGFIVGSVLLIIVAIVLFFFKFTIDEKEINTKQFAAIPLVLIGIMALISSCYVIPAGHVGVIDTFGNVNPRALTSGIQFANPMANVVKFSVQTKELKETMHVLSKEGLTIALEISALYSLNPDSAASIYKTVSGGDYETILLVPQFRSISRAVTAGFNASALYSTEREKLGSTIQDELGDTLSRRGIFIESTPLRNVGLPVQLTEAIEQKQRADQESQRMEFILTKERQEAERKRIEAQGIKDFQTIVSEGISDKLLEWKGIEATEKLAMSSNSKIVIIGNSADNLPVILGSGK